MQTGIVVWLQMEPEEIAERFSGNDEEVEKRPLLQGGDAVDKLRGEAWLLFKSFCASSTQALRSAVPIEILDKRKEKYEVADVHVQLSPGDSVEEVVERVSQGSPLKYGWAEKLQTRQSTMTELVDHAGVRKDPSLHGREPPEIC
eukprot:scaffold2201_cov240-Pinguiococcus_pyrenoidosus.AAC.11